MATPRIATIGYEGLPPADFLHLLREAGIRRVADVRAIANSRKPGYAKRALSAALEGAGIESSTSPPWARPPQAGRPCGRDSHAADAVRIYLPHLARPEARAALADLAQTSTRTPTCLLCLEADPDPLPSHPDRRGDARTMGLRRPRPRRPVRLMRAALLVLLALLAAGSGARAEGWRHFRIILWQMPTPAQIPALKRLGVEATKIIANRSGKGALVDRAAIAPLLAGGMRWYVENIATDFYAAYHRWLPHAPVNAAFLAAQRAHQADPASLAPFIRKPSLSDPGGAGRNHDAVAADGTRLDAIPGRLYYSLGDETGIADLAANWDSDFSHVSLAGFPRLAARPIWQPRRAECRMGHHAARWDEVTPITTTAAMAHTDDNFAPRSDFKAWMDTAFARAVRAGTDAVRAADPQARAAIEGAQIAGWGGYDYAKLAGAVNIMEIYDAGASLAMARSFNPQLVLLTTSFESGPAAIREIWQEALRGTSGLILWDPDNKVVQTDGSLGPRGREMATTFDALRGSAGDLLLRAPRVAQPVAIIASQASFRVRWLLRHRAAGDAWSKRSAADEWDDTSLRASTDQFASALRRIGIAPRFVSDAQVAGGALGKLRALILPEMLALSPEAAAAIRGFAAKGGLVIAEGEAGRFDAHGRRLPPPCSRGCLRTASRHPT